MQKERSAWTRSRVRLRKEFRRIESNTMSVNETTARREFYVFLRDWESFVLFHDRKLRAKRYHEIFRDECAIFRIVNVNVARDTLFLFLSSTSPRPKVIVRSMIISAALSGAIHSTNNAVHTARIVRERDWPVQRRCNQSCRCNYLPPRLKSPVHLRMSEDCVNMFSNVGWTQGLSPDAFSGP